MDVFQIVRRNSEAEFYSVIDNTDINQVNEFGQNLLQEAVAAKNTKLAGELIQRGINVNHQDSQGQTPLHFTGIHQTEELARAILEAGGDPSIKDVFGNSALWAAVVKPKRNYEIVRLMLQHGPDPHSRNKAGMSPLDFARQIKSERLIALLEGRDAQATG
jgi:uncharacterized protein